MVILGSLGDFGVSGRFWSFLADWPFLGQIDPGHFLGEMGPMGVVGVLVDTMVRCRG